MGKVGAKRKAAQGNNNLNQCVGGPAPRGCSPGRSELPVKEQWKSHFAEDTWLGLLEPGFPPEDLSLVLRVLSTELLGSRASSHPEKEELVGQRSAS